MNQHNVMRLFDGCKSASVVSARFVCEAVDGPGRKGRRHQTAVDESNAYHVDSIGVVYPRSYQEAKATGAKRYFTGLPCCRGHIAYRMSGKQGCSACNNEDYASAKKRKSASVRRQRAGSRKGCAVDLGIKSVWLMCCKRGHLYIRQGNRSCEKCRALNISSYRAQQRAKYWEDPEAKRAKVKAVRLNNLDKWRQKERNNKARRRNAEGEHTAADIAEKFMLQKGKCANPPCRMKLGDDYHVDHIVPVARGGTNYPSNLQLLCPRCNMAKGAKDPVEFNRMQGLLL